MRIDSHQHFWHYDPIRYSWITDDMSVIRRDFLSPDLKSLLDAHSFDGCVAVQADQVEDETTFLLDLASENPWIMGVVGWVDIRNPRLEERLEFFGEDKNFKGVRHVLQAEKPGFMTAPEFIRGLRTVAGHGLTYDILTTEGQLDETVRLVAQLPEMHLVIDHISKPDIKTGSYDHWARQMAILSDYPHIRMKLSGMVTEADWENWESDDFKRYMDFSLEHFGPHRLMFGSDWPVCLVAATYEDVLGIVEHAISGLGPSEQAAIMGGTASEFYNL